MGGFRKENLKQIRDHLKPIDGREILSFEKEYLERKKLYEIKREKDKKTYIIPASQKYVAMSTKWKEIAQREKFEEELKQIKEEETRENIVRRINYGKAVKKMHWPEISERKRKELLDRKIKLATKNARKRNSTKPPTSRKSDSLALHSAPEGGTLPVEKVVSKTPLKKVSKARSEYEYRSSRKGAATKLKLAIITYQK